MIPVRASKTKAGGRSGGEARTSIFSRRTVQDIYEEIQGVYESDHRPWVLGFSGGKDSTTSLQLVWNALRQLAPERRTKPVYVISSDTLVESPVVVNVLDQTLENINSAAQVQKMPIRAEKLRPQINDTFWVNLVGRGYPAPQKTFRWCTDRLKIKTADRFIVEKVSEHGECILILGVRREESMTRAQVMNLMKIKGSLLSNHSRFAQVLVYTPIEDFTVDDVWTYLLQTPSPWGGSNRDLAALYRNASGECPLVVDTYTPSCGGSRFGCWTCTVVTKDKSMEAMIDSGEDWMQPLLEFRDFLASTQTQEMKKKVRSVKRRDGRTKKKKDGSGKLVRGPYHLWFRKEMLRRLLQTEREVRRIGPDPSLRLITPDELAEIRQLWRMEEGDWEDSVPAIYEEVTGEKVPWVRDDFGSFTAREAEVLHEVCTKAGVPTGMVVKLLEAERQTQGMSRRSSIYSRIDSVLREEWRSEDQILAENGELEIDDDEDAEEAAQGATN